jgi:hypothetical protein
MWKNCNILNQVAYSLSSLHFTSKEYLENLFLLCKVILAAFILVLQIVNQSSNKRPLDDAKRKLKRNSWQETLLDITLIQDNLDLSEGHMCTELDEDLTPLPSRDVGLSQARKKRWTGKFKLLYSIVYMDIYTKALL